MAEAPEKHPPKFRRRARVATSTLPAKDAPEQEAAPETADAAPAGGEGTAPSEDAAPAQQTIATGLPVTSEEPKPRKKPRKRKSKKVEEPVEPALEPLTDEDYIAVGKLAAQAVRDVTTLEELAVEARHTLSLLERLGL